MIVVRKIAGLATVQDLGRIGYASHAVPRGGALIRNALRRANAAVGNVESAACIEVLGRLVVVAESEIAVATERADVRVLAAGEELALEPDRSIRARYLAIAGGVDAPLVLGSRSSLVGFGEMLKVGDRISESPPSGRALIAFDSDSLHAPDFSPGLPIHDVRIIAGPDCGDLDELTATEWKIGAASNRVGTRLEGNAMPSSGEVIASSPMTIGAIQLPSGGLPIVIGPDGPTTGGYPIIAVIARADLDAFHSIPLGGRVTFVRA